MSDLNSASTFHPFWEKFNKAVGCHYGFAHTAIHDLHEDLIDWILIAYCKDSKNPDLRIASLESKLRELESKIEKYQNEQGGYRLYEITFERCEKLETALREKEAEVERLNRILDTKTEQLQEQSQEIRRMRLALERSKTTLSSMKVWTEETCRLNRDIKPMKMVAEAEARIEELESQISKTSTKTGDVR